MAVERQHLTISLVIPAYNEENHLKACLGAIAEQSVKADEVIVVDNNSSDKTADIARSYPFVTLLRESQQGLFFARNIGLDAASSDIIGRIDADTILSKDWVKNVKAIFLDSAVSSATGPVNYYDMPLSRVSGWIDHQIRLLLYKRAPQVPLLYGSNMAMRKNAWLIIKQKVCRDRDISEDLDVAIHMMRSGLSILYGPSMVAGVSARRFDDAPRAFNQYMRFYHNTYLRHNVHSVVPRIATGFYWLFYITFRPFRLAYDDTTHKRSLAHLLSHHQPRKQPLAEV